MLLFHLWTAPTNVLLAKARGADAVWSTASSSGQLGCMLADSTAVLVSGRSAGLGLRPATQLALPSPPPNPMQVMFAHSMGPLLWSILAFRNSIVPHSLDKMTRQDGLCIDRLRGVSSLPGNPTMGLPAHSSAASAASAPPHPILCPPPHYSMQPLHALPARVRVLVPALAHERPAGGAPAHRPSSCGRVDDRRRAPPGAAAHGAQLPLHAAIRQLRRWVCRYLPHRHVVMMMMLVSVALQPPSAPLLPTPGALPVLGRALLLQDFRVVLKQDPAAQLRHPVQGEACGASMRLLSCLALAGWLASTR